MIENEEEIATPDMSDQTGAQGPASDADAGRTDARRALGARLDMVATEWRLSRTDLAARMGLSAKTISRYLDGERVPGADNLAPLEALGVDLTWLCTGVGTMRRGEPARPQGAAGQAAAPELEPATLAELVRAVAGAAEAGGLRPGPDALGKAVALSYMLWRRKKAEAAAQPGKSIAPDPQDPEYVEMLRILMG